MPQLKLLTKGKTLQKLRLLVRCSKVLPGLRVTAGAARTKLEAVVTRIQKRFNAPLLIVRSSVKAEDNLASSNAGHFCSRLNVPRDDRDAIGKAIDEVIRSYGPRCHDDEELFVQPMLTDINIAGVAFTADAATLAPYYTINYDECGRSDTITAGIAARSETYVYFKYAPITPALPVLAKIVQACREIEELTENPCLDIEFAVSGNQLYILQARPLKREGKQDLSSLDLTGSLLKIHRKVQKLSAAHPNLLGSKAIFGVMPDWNPAEMIGLRPRQLALSLYKELITDSVWAFQRDNYRYRNLRSHPLLVSFLGMPYIDIRVDFNSFIPKSLDERIAAKLVDYYIAKLDGSPELHDKVEFEIVHSCYYLTLPDRLEELRRHGFNTKEITAIEYALLDLTNTIVDPDQGLYKSDLNRIEQLARQHRSIIESDLSLIEKIYWLVEYCKCYGTLPFAGVARAAFIAVQFLRSFVDAGVMTAREKELFLGSLNTVAKQLQAKLRKLSNGEESREEFLRMFGHLRPGTYDILSPCYEESFDQYFSTFPESDSPITTYTLGDDQKKQINKLLRENGIQTDAEGLFRFMTETIEGREYSKLVFSKSLNGILTLIGKMGVEYEISREDISFVDIKTVLNLYASLDHRNLKEILQADILVNRKLHDYTKALKLPALLRRPSDVYGFFLDAENPSFVTLAKITAETVVQEAIDSCSLVGKILFIRAADPGYDFVFSRKISGLVTQFGGANSHMAIRCAELGIPAVIGAGEKNFSAWSSAHVLEIDCAGCQVRVVS